MRKTSRARLKSLVLVNWKGFFYQRFEIDDGVTALEGENGAGKTTVMIGAFVALLPDQRLLQFRNVSETGGMEGERGIYGRLGSKGVAYTIMELHVPRYGRMLAGVMLVKKAPPSLGLTPFIAGGLANDHSLDEILLLRDGQTERVPELSEIRQKLGQIGCTLDVYDSVGQYTSKLFDLGVSPMSMEAYSERDRFNRILQTSMYGGLSSSIQKGLRDYLLAEDTSLRNHVARMRENLDACRVTRQEIESAERKYKIIEGVFRTGYGMFESAFHGTRLRVVGSRKRAENSRADHFRCKQELKELERRLRELEHSHSELQSDLREREKEYERAESFLRDCREARKTAMKIERHSAACLVAVQELEQSEDLFRGMEKRFRESEWTRDRLLAEKDQIALGLSDASKAWEQVSMKVALLKQARQTLEDARNALPDHEVSSDSAADLLAECFEQWNHALENKTRVGKELDSLNARIKNYEEVLDALGNGLQRQVTPERALEAAREFDDNFREMQRLTREAETLPERIDNAGRTAERQQAVRQRLALLERKGEKVESAADLRSLFEMMQKEQDSLAEERSSLQEHHAGLREELAGSRRQLERLESEAEDWRQARILTRRLEDAFEMAIEDTRSLEGLEHRIRADLETARGRLGSLRDEHESTQEKVSELEFGGGRLDESLVRLRDLIDGRLVVELYDDIPEVDAPMIEARLGPLHGALLVEDIPEAVEKISWEPDFPDHVWLMEAGALTEVPEGKPYPASELVKMGDCWRLSRHPERPVVGRAAREREIERLKAHAITLRAEIETVRAREARFLEGIETTGKLRQYYRLIGLPDPSEPVIRLNKRIREIQGEELLVNRRMAVIDQRHRHCREVLESLAKCLPDADLLDQNDWFETVAALKTQLKEADSIKSRMEAVRPVILRVRAGMFDLEYPPPGPDVVLGLTEAGKRAEAVLEYWSKGRELLSMLIDRLPHLQFQDQEKLLIGQKSALKALEDKKIEVDQAYQAARVEVDHAGEEYEQARGQLNTADAKYKALYEKIENLRQELVESGQDGTRESLEQSETFKEVAAKKLKSAQEVEREIGNELIRAEKDMEMGVNRTADVRERRKKDIE
ncbi:MAG: ATP-binding protein, partial [Syntrophobacteraceae bacterium]